jgi:hypothetical protein
LTEWLVNILKAHLRKISFHAMDSGDGFIEGSDFTVELQLIYLVEQAPQMRARLEAFPQEMATQKQPGWRPMFNAYPARALNEPILFMRRRGRPAR